MKNPCLAAALEELNAASVDRITRSQNGKHLQLRWQTNDNSGTIRMVTLPLTPSDWRSPENTRSDIRKILRADGMLPLVERKPPPPKTPDRITRLEQRLVAQEQRIVALEQRIAALERGADEPPKPARDGAHNGINNKGHAS